MGRLLAAEVFPIAAEEVIPRILAGASTVAKCGLTSRNSMRRGQDLEYL